MSSEERPDVRLRKHIGAEYQVGSHDGRPVAIPKDAITVEPIYLDDPHGMAAWRYGLIHHRGKVIDTTWWTGMHLVDVEALVKFETSRLAAEAAEHGPELELLAGEYGELVSIADRRHWSRSELTRLFRSHAMVDEIRELVEHQKTARAMAESTEGFSWVNLADDWDAEPSLPDRLVRTDGMCGLYAAQRNLVIGFTESGKTWLEVYAVAQEIRAGRPVVLLDHENGEAVIRDRLKALNVDKEQVKNLLRYSFLTAPLSPEFANEQARQLWAEGARLMMVDALTPVSAAMGIDLSGGNVNGVEQVYATVLDPWVRVGFCATMIDNTGKRDKEDASGSQHKVAGIGGAVLAVAAQTKWAKGRSGRSRIYLNKDRGGAVRHELSDGKRLFATMRVDPAEEDLVTVLLEPPEAPTVAAATAVATVVDIVTQTCELAAQAIRKHGVTEVRSMRLLAGWMKTVHEIDESAYPVAHTDRDHLTSCLTKVASGDDLAMAGIGVEARATTSSIRYRVWVT